MSIRGREILRGQLFVPDRTIRHDIVEPGRKAVIAVAYCGTPLSDSNPNGQSAQVLLSEVVNEEYNFSRQKLKDTILLDRAVFRAEQSRHTVVSELYYFSVTVSNGKLYEFIADTNNGFLRWAEVLQLLSTFPLSSIPGEPSKNPIQNTFRQSLSAKDYRADSVWPVYILPEEVGSRFSGLIGLRVFALRSRVSYARVDSVKIFDPDDPGTPVVTWDRDKMRRTGQFGNLVYLEIGRRCHGGPGLVWMYCDYGEAQNLKETILKFLFEGDGRAVSKSVPPITKPSPLPSLYADDRAPWAAMDSRSLFDEVECDGASLPPPEWFESDSPGPPVRLGKHPSFRSRRASSPPLELFDEVEYDGPPVRLDKHPSTWRKRSLATSRISPTFSVEEFLSPYESISASFSMDSGAKKIFDDALKVGYVTIDMINALLLGTAGVGKTSSKNVLLDLHPPDVRTSTPLAEVPVKICIREVSGSRMQASESGWKSVSTEDLQQLVIDTLSSCRDDLKKVPKDLQELLKTLPTNEGADPEPRDSLVQDAEQSDTSTASCGLDTPGPADTNLKSPDQQACQTAIANIMGEMVDLLSKRSAAFQYLGRDPREILGSKMIHLIDSGGQPHFHNLLPHFLRGISAAMYVHRLSGKLSDHPLVEYYEQDKPISTPFLSPLTTLDTLKYLVRSMQSHVVNGEKPKLIFIGTFLDELSKCNESLEQKNEKLLELLTPEFLDQLVFCDENLKQIIFALDAKHPGEREKQMAAVLRSIVEKSPSQKFNVPIWWYVLEIHLEKLTQLLDRKVLRKVECLEVARQLNFHKDALIVALHFFHDHHILHYYPKVLPEIIFSSPQVLLDKLTELVKEAYLLRGNASTPVASTLPQSARSGKWHQFRDQGVITQEFLEEFPQHYVDGLFEPPDLLKIFVSLLILTPFSSKLDEEVDFSSRSAEYFMPCLLDMLLPTEIEKHRVSSSAAAPLLIRYPNGWPRSGVFCCLQVYLIQHCGWKLVLRDGKPRLIAQNCVMLSPPKCAGLVTLIDSFAYLEVHISAKPSVCRRVCPRVCHTVLHGIDASCQALRYRDDPPHFAFFCPCLDDSDSSFVDAASSFEKASATATNPTTVCQRRHAAVVLEEDDSLCCTNDEGNYPDLEEEHKIWLSSAPPTAELTLCVLTKELKPLTKPIPFGIALNISQEVLEVIEEDHRLDTNGQKIAVFKYIAGNCRQLGITWKTIADSLRDIHGDLSLSIRDKYKMYM